MKLTDTNVAALPLPVGEKDTFVWDSLVPGFGCRIKATNVRTWVFQYKAPGGLTRRLTIDRTTALKAVRARSVAADYRAKVRLGQDPVAEKRAAAERSRDTFGALVHLHLERCKDGVRFNTFRDKRRALVDYAKPLHSTPLDAIDQRAIARLLTQIELSSGAVSANRARSHLNSLFSWALKEGIARTNPAADTFKRPEHSRDRVLSNAELTLIWKALPPDTDYEAIVRLLILTGQRASEISRLSWSEIQGGEIRLPRERTKNGRAHVVPLSPTAMGILGQRTPRVDTDLIFGKRRGAAFTAWTQYKAVLDQRIAELNSAPIPPFVIHDIRRSVASGLGDLGVQPHIVEAILNHVSGTRAGVASVYNKSTYATEVRTALLRWDEHVSAIVSGEDSNVTPIVRRGA